MIQKHLHRYRRRNLTRDKSKPPYIVFACLKPNCTHWIEVKMALGKEAECYICGNKFIIGKVELGQAKPHCVNCTKGKDGKVKAKQIEVNDEAFNNLLSEIGIKV